MPAIGMARCKAGATLPGAGEAGGAAGAVAGASGVEDGSGVDDACAGEGVAAEEDDAGSGDGAGVGALPPADTGATGRPPKIHNASARNSIPEANPSANIPTVLARMSLNSRYSCKIAGVPGFTMFASSEASQLVSRMHPWDIAWPMSDGSGVPWIP